VFFDIELHDWTIRHDIIGDGGSLLKTIKQRGEGYDRPRDFDEINLSFHIYQGEVELEEIVEQDYLMSDKEAFPAIVLKILSTMKTLEITSTAVKPEYMD